MGGLSMQCLRCKVPMILKRNIKQNPSELEHKHVQTRLIFEKPEQDVAYSNSHVCNGKFKY